MAKYKIIPSSRNIVQSPISIGHKAEKGVEAIEFDLTAWVETYGSGTLTVIMRRWGDAIPYPIALEIDENNKATWTLSDTDTAKAGMAYAQLSYIVGETVVKKSDIYTFRVMDSLVGEGEPPEAYESWLEHLTHFAAEAMAEVLDIEGIVTDKTLTVDGGIADAKAAGDALALKADKSTTYTKAEVDQMIEDVEVETDTTLEIAGAPADAAETGRQIGLLKADLTTLADITPIPDNSDLNDYTETGLYTIEYGNYTILHYATETVSTSYLEVTALTTGYITQKLTKGNGDVFIRGRYSNGNWTDWVQIARDISTAQVFTDEIKAAILNAFDNVAWANTSGRQYYNALYNALNGIEYPKIIATLSLGTNKVYSIDSVDILRTYLTVTYYEDSSDAGSVITNYAISGNLSDGTNKVKVQYSGLSVYVAVSVTDFYNVFKWTAQDNRYSVVNGAIERVDVDSTINRVVIVNQSQTARKVLGLSFGDLKLVKSETLQPVNVYPIPIPDNAIEVKVTYTTAVGATVKYIFDTITKHTQSDDYYYMNGYGSWLSSGETTTLAASGKSNRWGIVVFDGNDAGTQNFSNVQIDFLTEE